MSLQILSIPPFLVLSQRTFLSWCPKWIFIFLKFNAMIIYKIKLEGQGSNLRISHYYSTLNLPRFSPWRQFWPLHTDLPFNEEVWKRNDGSLFKRPLFQPFMSALMAGYRSEAFAKTFYHQMHFYITAFCA